MDHQSFRFQIPGIIFLTPVYVVACYIAFNEYGDKEKIRDFVLVSGLAAFLSVSLPIGWWIYNAYRVWWIKWTRGGYERKEFVKMLRRNIRPIYIPGNKTVLLNFTGITDIDSWISISIGQFRRAFYPFTKKSEFHRKAKKEDLRLNFAEPLSDFILWKDPAYDYARSISSVRYSLESSLFALLLGGLYALAIWAIWTALIPEANITSRLIFGIVLLGLLTAAMFYTLARRWRSASREYDARLLLTTMIRSGKNNFPVKSLETGLPAELVTRINALKPGPNPYAAFDLDNTLLTGDIGDAVFASLLADQLVKGFSWSDYQSLVETDRTEAYKKVISVMNGLELSKLKTVTKKILTTEADHIDTGNEKVIVPRPNPVMQALVYLLKSKGIEVHVVTASNEVSAQQICWKYFGIPASNVHGVKLRTDSGGRIDYDNGSIPHAGGKVTLLEEKFKRRPILTGGDGVWDEPLLRYTEEQGIRLWLGNPAELQQLQKNQLKDIEVLQVTAEPVSQPIA